VIFQHTWQLILAGRKTQTRRLVKSDRAPWVAGRSYAVQPGRTQKSIGRIVVLRVWQEPLGAISEADAQAEGFADRAEFLAGWEKIHGTFDPSKPVWVVEFEIQKPVDFLTAHKPG